MRATDLGAGEITALEDLVPLLFSHSVYKSYPEVLVRQRHWLGLAKWLDTLSVERGAVDVEFGETSTIDQWVETLRKVGHLVGATSGTTGKCSIFNRTTEEAEVGARQRNRLLSWSTGISQDARIPMFILLPRRSVYLTVDLFRSVADQFARPDAVYWMTQEPLLMSDINRMGELRRAIAKGEAMPSDLAEFEAEGQARSRRIQADFDKMVGVLVDHLSEPVIIAGLVPQHWELVKALKARGVTSPALHPDSIVWPGGGTKGSTLPDDYLEQMRTFYGVSDEKWHRTYSMTELNSQTVACSRGNFHFSPWQIPLVLDVTGEKLVEPRDGVLKGRMAFFDVAVSARWGGIVSGDRVTVDLRPCECGRRSPTVRSIGRYEDAEDEKLTCAGTIESYVRGLTLEQ
jgi:hypothetical protein